MRNISILFFIFSILLGINPPNSGSFPEGFWDKMKEQGIGQNYGDPGWIRKINNWKQSEQRDAQLEFFVPVLLGKYADVNTTYFSASDYQNMLFDNNATGSMKQFYDEISYGNFSVDGDAAGWYNSSSTMQQAVDNTREYVANVAALADGDFNYGLYDNDGPDNIPNSGDDDGYVDGIIVVYSGCGAEWSPGNDNLWPHVSSLGSYEYTTNDASANGGNIVVSSYAVCPELSGGGDCNTSVIRPMGVYAHEFGHIIGLPDLYDRDNSDGDSEGLGEWCLMASGSWLGVGGDTPAHMSAWCKNQMGWLEPTVLNNNTNGVEIHEIETEPYAIKIWEDDYEHDRYFLIENRQAIGFDSEINGTGLMIYHIDESRGYGSRFYSGGPVNDNANHKMVDLEEADGANNLDNNENRGDSGDPFPGFSFNNNFNNLTIPNSDNYDGESTGIAVENISESDIVMTADITIRPTTGYSIVYDEGGISGYSYGYSDPNPTYAGVVFTPTISGVLEEVDFGTPFSDLNFELLIYESFNESAPGNLLASYTGYISEPGWHTIQVDPIDVVEGVDFFVAIVFEGSVYASFDYSMIYTGNSFLSPDGINYYEDISYYGNLNIRAKINHGELAIGDKSITAESFKLFPAFPNPFNPNTVIRYSLPQKAMVSLNIFDLKGRLIRSLVETYQEPGMKSVTWNARDNHGRSLPTGIYFYKIQSENFFESKKVIYIK